MFVGLTFQRGLYGKKGFGMRQSIRSTLSAATGAGATVRRTVSVTLLNKETLQILVEPKGKVADIFNQVCDHLGLRETEYFSLAQLVDGEYHFVDLDQKVSKVAPKTWRSQHNSDLPVINLYFRVQFYVDHVMLLRERVTRLQYYLQLRDNMLHATQLCQEERCFLLAAYALQADLGSYNTHKHARAYFDPREYFPAWVISKHGSDYIVNSMPAMHSDLSGMTKMEAQMQYIKDVSAPPAAHNLHFYRLKKRKTDALGTAWLGICPKGIEIYEEIDEGFKSLLSTFVWSSIGKLYFEKKKFEIRAVGSPAGRKFTYYTGSDERSKYLLQLCRATHLFQMTVQPKLAEIRHLEAEDKRRFRQSHREAYIYSDRKELDRDQGRGSTSWSGKFSQGSSAINSLPSTQCSSIMDQRVSVISNTSSNTTSGIVSDRMYQSFDDSEDDMRHTEIMIDSPPSRLANHVPGSFRGPNARSTPLLLNQGKIHIGMSHAHNLSHARSSGSHSYSMVSRSSSGHSQRSGKLSLSPIADNAILPPTSIIHHLPVPAEVQIQRINLAPSMTVTSTKVPPGVGNVYSGVATSGSPSLPVHLTNQVPATSATYVNVSEMMMASGIYTGVAGNSGNMMNNGITTAPVPTYSQPEYTTQLMQQSSPHSAEPYTSRMVGQTFFAESQPVSQMVTPVYTGALPPNSGALLDQVIAPSGMNQVNSYRLYENVPPYALTSAPNAVDYSTHQSTSPPEYPLKILSVSTNPTMLVSSHPHIPPGVLPQQCLPVEPRPPVTSALPVSQSSPQHIIQQGPPLTPHLHHSAIQMTQTQALTPPTIHNPPTCHQPPPSPSHLIPPPSTAHIPQLVINQPPLSSNQKNIPKPDSQPNTPPAMNKSQSPMSVVIDHSVTVDDTTAGPSTPLTVLPPPSPSFPTVSEPPTPSAKVENAPNAKGATSPGARGQRGGLVPTGEAWGYSPSEGRAAARHHSMGKFDQLLSPNASRDRDPEARRRGRRSKTCPVHGMTQDVAAELQILTNKNHSVPLLIALCSDSSLIQQVAEKCSCTGANGQNTSREEKSNTLSISQPGTMISNEPGVIARPVSWHSGTFNLDQTLKLLKDEELLRSVGVVVQKSSVSLPTPTQEGSTGGLHVKRSRSSSEDQPNHQNSYHRPRPHSDELASLTQSQLNAAPLIAGLLAPRSPLALETPSRGIMGNYSGAMFPSKLTSGGHSPNSSETLHQQANMGLA